MFARIYSILFMLASFALFASASPVPNNGAVVRGDGGSDVATRCDNGCGDDIANILLTLEANVQAAVEILDGHADPTQAVVNIVAAIQVAVDAVVDVKLSTPLVSAEIQLCVSIFVRIIVAILTALSAYGLDVVVSLYTEIDAQVCLLIKALISVCADLEVAIHLGLQVHLDLVVVLKVVVGLLGL